ncbi:MAG: hypothetical protein ACK4S0_07100 [Sediminibacterium sp.]
MKVSTLYTLFIASSLLFVACKKGDAPTPNPPTPNPPPTPTPKTCYLSGITQANTGSKPDFALSLTLNASNEVTAFVLFDSLGNKKLSEANFVYASTDSIRLDQYQYIKLDANKRVKTFVTLADISNPAQSDVYRYEYVYNNNGYLSTKNQYINNSATSYYTTTYTYTDNLLTKCLVTVTGNSNQKILESDLSYDATATAKNWVYAFPDAFESYLYSSALNFGNKPARPMTQVVTKIYNPINNNVLDTWTTNFSAYSFNTDGYIQSVTASGDLQQGMAIFYGKTQFAYSCK